VVEKAGELLPATGERLPERQDMGRGDVGVQDLDRSLIAAGVDVGHVEPAEVEGHVADRPRPAEGDPHALVVPRGLELAEGEESGEDLGLVEPQLLDGDQIRLDRLHQHAERLRVGAVVLQVRRHHAEPALHRASSATTAGRRWAHDAAASNAAAARSTAVSWRRRPTIWSPTGSPAAVNPQGTEMAGSPVSEIA